MRQLTGKQKLFVQEYLVDLNATQAYIRAGYTVKNDKVAAVMAWRLLNNDNVQAAIQSAMDARAKRTEITQDRVISELAKIAFASGADYAKVVTKSVIRNTQNPDTGEIEPTETIAQRVEFADTDTLSDDLRAAIAGIKETKHGIEVQTCDKVKALELLARHLGLLNDKMAVSGIDPVVFYGGDDIAD